MVLGRSCKEDFGFVCKGLPADNEHEGKEYCVLHCPSVDKDQAEFEEAVEKKVKDKDFDFRGVYFPGWQSLAPFRISTLPNGTFEELADFSDATFEEVNFYRATFKGEADFSGATFEEVSFEDVTFEEEAYLDRTTFNREAYFRGPETFSRVADFQFARIEKPELFSFHRG